MRANGFRPLSGLVALLLLLGSGSALAQWYEDDELPPGEGQIINPFTFKGFQMGSGFSLTSALAPGEDLVGLSSILAGGYKFSGLPLYLGATLPMGIQFPDQGDTEFALGAIGLNLKGRVDPDNVTLGIFTGWSLDLYIPTFMDKPAGHAAGFFNHLYPGMHLALEAINVVGTFDFVVPGRWFFFQFELSVAAYFPVKDTDQRSVEGGILWGAVLGVNLARPIAFLVEFKGYSPLGVEQADGTPQPSMFGISPGLRLTLGPFKPGIWCTFPLDSDYRSFWPDVIIGLDLSAWF